MSTIPDHRSFPWAAQPRRWAGDWSAVVVDKRMAVPLAVLCVSVTIAVVAYTQFLQHDRSLWDRCTHDRNAHYSLGVNFALGIRQGDVVSVLRNFHQSRVWGPLHGMLVSIPLIFTGPDYRLAVLPSLLGWVGTAVFAFLLARRACPRGGNLGGILAALFVLASPAHHAFATDIMLESLGACFTMVVLYAYVRSTQDGTRHSVPLLGVALTLLFTLKYNYWLLVFLAIIVQELTSKLPRYRRQWAKIRDSVGGRQFLTAQLRHPLSWIIAMLILVAVYVTATGGGVFYLFGQRISITAPPPPQNLLTITYLLICVRLAQLWLPHRVAIRQVLTTGQHQFFCWHILPITIWLLWPKRLAYFLWFLSPANASERMGLLDGLPAYLEWIQRDYHAMNWAAALIAGLSLVALMNTRHGPRGALVIVWFVLLASLLTVQHPNHKSRFLHSWIPAVWVLAGTGFASLAVGRKSIQHGRYGGLRQIIAASGLACVGIAHLPGILHPAQSPDGGPRPSSPTTLNWAECYLAELDDAQHPIITSNQPIRQLLSWTYRSRFPHRREPEFDIRKYGRSAEENQQVFQQWLHEKRCDALIYVHIPGDSRFCEFTDLAGHDQLRSMLNNQNSFRPVTRWTAPDDSLTVTLWKRDASAPLRVARLPAVSAGTALR